MHLPNKVIRFQVNRKALPQNACVHEAPAFNIQQVFYPAHMRP